MSLLSTNPAFQSLQNLATTSTMGKKFCLFLFSLKLFCANLFKTDSFLFFFLKKKIEKNIFLPSIDSWSNSRKSFDSLPFMKPSMDSQKAFPKSSPPFFQSNSNHTINNSSRPFSREDRLRIFFSTHSMEKFDIPLSKNESSFKYNYLLKTKSK